MLVNGSDVTFERARDAWKRLIAAVPKGKFIRVLEDAQLIEMIMGTAFVNARELEERRRADSQPHA